MTEHSFPGLAEVFYEERLPNGLLLRVTPKPDFTRTYAFFAANYGSIDTRFEAGGTRFETPAGVAHYLEHKMFDMPDLDVMREFTRLGGSPNAFTSYAMTAYHVECTQNWEDNLALLLRFVSTPYFTEESVEKERGIIAQEIRMYEDNPDSRMYENLFRALYDRHPVRSPIAGTVESIQQITAATLADCHRAFYAPGNMILCVVGPVTPERVFAVAVENLPVLGAAPAVRDYGAPERPQANTPRVEARMEVATPGFTIGFHCDGGGDPLRRELTGDLAMEVLAGESSALYTRLYEEGLIEPDFSAGYEGIKDLGLLTAGGSCGDPEAVIDAIFAEAGRIVREGSDPRLFERLKRSAFGRRVRELDSFENICYRMSQCYFEGADYYAFPDLYRSITKEEVEDLISRTIVPERSAVSLIYPKERS